MKALLLVVPLTLLLACSRGSGAPAQLSLLPGCGPAVPPSADDSFTKMAGRRGPAAYPELVGHKTIRTACSGPAEDKTIDSYYGRDPLAENETIATFLAKGGVHVSQKAAQGLDIVKDAMEQLGKRGAVVEVGPYRAVWVHGDPLLRDDSRAYNIYWTDGVRDWKIQGNVSNPAEVIDLARSLYC